MTTFYSFVLLSATCLLQFRPSQCQAMTGECRILDNPRFTFSIESMIGETDNNIMSCNWIENVATFQEIFNRREKYCEMKGVTKNCPRACGQCCSMNNKMGTIEESCFKWDTCKSLMENPISTLTDEYQYAKRITLVYSLGVISSNNDIDDTQSLFNDDDFKKTVTTAANQMCKAGLVGCDFNDNTVPSIMLDGGKIIDVHFNTTHLIQGSNVGSYTWCSTQLETLPSNVRCYGATGSVHITYLTTNNSPSEALIENRIIEQLQRALNENGDLMASSMNNIVALQYNFDPDMTKCIISIPTNATSTEVELHFKSSIDTTVHDLLDDINYSFCNTYTGRRNLSTRKLEGAIDVVSIDVTAFEEYAIDCSFSPCLPLYKANGIVSYIGASTDTALFIKETNLFLEDKLPDHIIVDKLIMKKSLSDNVPKMVLDENNQLAIHPIALLLIVCIALVGVSAALFVVRRRRRRLNIIESRYLQNAANTTIVQHHEDVELSLEPIGVEGNDPMSFPITFNDSDEWVVATVNHKTVDV